MRPDEIASSDDTSALWAALVEAKKQGATDTVRAIEQRMRELSEMQRFAGLTDQELQRRINALTANLEPKGLLAHSPDGNLAGGWDVTYTSRHNAAIRKNQQVGGVDTLVALRAEWARRHPPPGR